MKEPEKRKSPNPVNGARKIKAYKFLSCFSVILGIIFCVLKEHELFQDFTISGILLELIALGKKVN